MPCAPPMSRPCPPRSRSCSASPPASRPAAAIGAGEAARIFTGAQVPPGADTIVIQENCDEADEHVTVREGNRKLGQHIRKGRPRFPHRRHRHRIPAAA